MKLRINPITTSYSIMKIKIVFTAILLLFSFIEIEAQNKIEISSKQASAMLKNDPKVIVLDVRTPEEFNEGHINKAINFDVYQSDVFIKINKLNKNAKYIVYCRTNRRSGVVAKQMIQSGFKNVYQMMDGFPGWQGNKLPVRK